MYKNDEIGVSLGIQKRDESNIVRSSKMLIVLALLFFYPLPTEAMDVQKANQIVRTFNDYISALKEIEKNCEVSFSESEFFLVDSIQCSWRNEERLIENTGLGGVLYDPAYKRYSKKHRLAKETLLKISYLKSQQKILREIKMFLIEKQAIHNHTHTQQIEIIENCISSN